MMCLVNPQHLCGLWDTNSEKYKRNQGDSHFSRRVLDKCIIWAAREKKEIFSLLNSQI